MKFINTLFVLVTIVGCAPIAMLKSETIDGGHVQVTGPGCLAPVGMNKAEEVMSKKCPQGYEKIKWGEESAGATIGTGMGGAVEMPARFVDFKCTDKRSPASN